MKGNIKFRTRFMRRHSQIQADIDAVTVKQFNTVNEERTVDTRENHSLKFINTIRDTFKH